MFGQCLDQQRGLKTWMAAQNISDYGGLQQYFTRRLRSQVLSPLRPAPAVVVWEDDDSSAVADSSLGAADIGQVYGGDGCKPHRSCGALAEPGSAFPQLSGDGLRTGAGIGRVAGGGRLATVSPSVWYLPGTSDSTAWGDVYGWEMRSCANISDSAWERVLGGEFCMVRSHQPAAV